MKVFFNHLPNTGRYCLGTKPTVKQQQSTIYNQTNFVPSSSAYSLAFMARPDSTMLLAQADKLLCAYSRRPMLSPYKFRSLSAKLDKKPTAQAAINFLKEYREYMPQVETEVFSLFEEYDAKGKKNFQDILIEKRAESLENLRRKQREILNSTNGMLKNVDNMMAEDFLSLRDVALLKVEDGTFSRSEVLNHLGILMKKGKYKDTFEEIYKKWYTLPRSYMDYDAFVVKYSRFPHNEIAQRLLSMSVATVEHIKPYANGGNDNLWNYALVCKLYNTDKGDMNLAEYDKLNPNIGIKTNLPKYIDDICREIKCGNKYFECNDLYPKMLRANIILETNWWHLPKVKTPELSYSDRQIPSSRKGANRYRQNRK